MAAKYSYLDIINRAKIYVDDNNKVTEGWKRLDDWLAILRPEVLACYRKWIREGLISLSWVDETFTGPTHAFANINYAPLCIIGVVQNMGSYYRPVLPAQAQLGRAPFFQPNSIAGLATTWTASFGFVGEDVNIIPDNENMGIYQLRLHPPDTSSNYIVRYIPEPFVPTLVSSLSTVVFFAPEGYDDYLALRLARKAIASEGGSSQAIEKLIMVAELDMKMDTLSNPMGEAPKVRVVKPFNRQALGSNPWQVNPYNWFYF